MLIEAIMRFTQRLECGHLIRESTNLHYDQELQAESVDSSFKLLKIFGFCFPFVFIFANYVFFKALPNFHMPITAVVATAIALFPLVLRSRVEDPSKMIKIMIASALLASLIVLVNTILFSERLLVLYGFQAYQLPKTVIICLTASFASCITIVYYSIPFVGLIITLVLYPIGIAASTIQQDIYGVTVGFMYAPIAITLIQIAWIVSRSRIADSKTRRALVREQRRANYLINHDTLTGLANRKKFQEYFDTCLFESGPDKIVVALIDLDEFKAINDTHGHFVGDVLLNRIASRIREVADQYNGLAARLGGDEFVIIAKTEEGKDALEKLGQDIIGAMTDPVDIEGNLIQPKCSVGLSIGQLELSTSSRILRAADKALYCAKADGKNIYRLSQQAHEEA